MHAGPNYFNGAVRRMGPSLIVAPMQFFNCVNKSSGGCPADCRFANRLRILQRIYATDLNREAILIVAEAVARVAYSRSAAGTEAFLQHQDSPKMNATRWAMGCALVLSAWIMTSPLVVPADSHATWNFYVAGAIGALLALVAFLRSDNVAEYGLLTLSAWLIVSPWLLNLPDLPTRQTLLYGMVIGGMAWFGRPTYKPKSSV
jgi:hypothetical protein